MMNASRGTSPQTTLHEAARGIAEQLGLKIEQLAPVLGFTPLECARFLSGRVALSPDSLALERFALLADIHRALARLIKHDHSAMREWLHRPIEALGAAPIALMGSAKGLFQVLHLIGSQLPEIKGSMTAWK